MGLRARGSHCAVGWLHRRRLSAGRLRRRQCLVREHLRQPAERTGAAGHQYRHRTGQGRADPAAVGGRKCVGRRAVDAQRRGDGAGGIQQSGHPASRQGRRWQRGGRAAGRAAGCRRGCRDHPGSALCADGWAGRTGGARPQGSGHRVLDRCQCGIARRLSAELSAGIRRRSDHWLRRRPGQTRVRRAGAR